MSFYSSTIRYKQVRASLAITSPTASHSGLTLSPVSVCLCSFALPRPAKALRYQEFRGWRLHVISQPAPLQDSCRIALSDLLKSSLVGRWRTSASPLQLLRELDLHPLQASSAVPARRLSQAARLTEAASVPRSCFAHSSFKGRHPLSAVSSHSGQCRSHVKGHQRSPNLAKGPPPPKTKAGTPSGAFLMRGP